MIYPEPYSIYFRGTTEAPLTMIVMGPGSEGSTEGMVVTGLPWVSTSPISWVPLNVAYLKIVRASEG